LTIRELKVGGRIELKGPLKASIIKVGGSFNVEGDLEVDD